MTNDHVKHFSNKCDICKVVKVVHENWSQKLVNNCNTNRSVFMNYFHNLTDITLVGKMFNMIIGSGTTTSTVLNPKERKKQTEKSLFCHSVQMIQHCVQGPF